MQLPLPAQFHLAQDLSGACVPPGTGYGFSPRKPCFEFSHTIAWKAIMFFPEDQQHPAILNARVLTYSILSTAPFTSKGSCAASQVGAWLLPRRRHHSLALLMRYEAASVVLFVQIYRLCSITSSTWLNSSCLHHFFSSCSFPQPAPQHRCSTHLLLHSQSSQSHPTCQRKGRKAPLSRLLS